MLVPSAFISPRAATKSRYSPWPVTVVYPARGAGTAWWRRENAGSLDRLLGATRATILDELDEAATTTGLAQRVGRAPSTVSEHLAVLRENGLVESSRVGQFISHSRTAAGDALMDVERSSA